jgi:hypothetical protein
MDAGGDARYGGSAGNWTRTLQDWTGAAVEGDIERSDGDTWAVVFIALGGAASCACACVLCWRWRAGRAVHVAVTF